MHDGGLYVTWCEACEWNAQLVPPDPHRNFLDRFRRRMTIRAAARLHGEMTQHASAPRRFDAATVGLVALSLVPLAGLVLLGVLAGWLILFASGFWRWPAAALAALVLWSLVPRPSRVSEDVVLLTREEAPQLWRLIDEVASGVGTAPPDLVGVDISYNAYMVKPGWRRRQLLVIGLAMWATERPQERVATLAHELGHLRHGDAARLRLTGAGMDVLERMISLLWPSLLLDDPDQAYDELLALLGSLGNGLRRALAMPAIALLLLALRLEARSRQRGEYLADLASVRLAGREAAAMSLQKSLAINGIEARAGAAVRRGEDPWKAYNDSVAPPAHELRRLMLGCERRQHAVDASHPPTHLRVSLVQAQEDSPGELRLDQAWLTVIERELAPARRELARSLRDELLEA